MMWEFNGVGHGAGGGGRSKDAQNKRSATVIEIESIIVYMARKVVK